MEKGIGASSGYGIGRAFIYKQQQLTIDKTPIEPDEVKREIESYHSAKTLATQQILKIKVRASLILKASEAKVFDAHLNVLKDPGLDKRVIKYIQDKQYRAAYAVSLVQDELFNMFQMMENAVMKERALDIKDVCTRIIYCLKGMTLPTLSDLEANTIVIAENLTPSDTVQMDVSKVVGIIVEAGGRTSHTAIMARSLEIPAVVGAKSMTALAENGQFVCLDGESGEICIEPDDAMKEMFEQKRLDYLEAMTELRKYATTASNTVDGRNVEICANIGNASDAGNSMKFGPNGVGLFRTEFLYMGKSNWPSEDEQFEEYKKVAELMQDKATIIRTLDIGGDKELSYIDFGKEENPFLGWRAMRMCLDKTDVLKTQFRAILRASAYGKLMIMYPMIINVTEVKRANALLEEVKASLKAENLPFDEAIQVGIMIETPAAAVTADSLIKYVDFFSIGTNDLTQYTLAVDRGNEKIADLYTPYHPAVLRLIKMVVDASHKAGKWTGMCGELAGEANLTKLLIGIGLDELSMTASSILSVRKNVVNIHYEEAKKLAQKALNMETAEAVLALMNE
ncbi:phosphoenolpyruvate--protein phosphotransferase [Fusibacter paucivorans]|uniref:Phosphoenolpyruvate-protein phosphotransferase n=1 Tax=Fusibacter paucivorans TaxID=76009 RepID=A0ABS5PLX1_9FIRM|nr:phosphoenolpyruvate--protein phosphotransferase [Fusibacter paucivorans]MBS7525927.1 phosphoenolpyruvate--protein phosphotransferase [Fusibacter paucivorans]